MRVDGENLAAAPIERILGRIPEVSQVAVYAVPDERVGDQVMAALVLRDGSRLAPDDFARFLVAQPDLSPKAWPCYVRINDALPVTATNKILKRDLVAAGANAQGGVLWTRPARGTAYSAVSIPAG
jgi:fatty-acyl-CoA synthase